jgi:DNA-binding NarL/FixJ family response regulator
MAPSAKIRVVVVHGEHLTAQALQRALASERDLVAEAATADPGAAVVLVADLAPDVAVVDLGLPQDGGVDAVRRMAEASPGTAFLALSEGDDLVVARAVEAGASGHVPKSAPMKELAEAVRVAARGDSLVGPEERRHLLRRLRHRRAEVTCSPI